MPEQQICSSFLAHFNLKLWILNQFCLEYIQPYSCLLFLWLKNRTFHLSTALPGSGTVWGVRTLLFEEKNIKRRPKRRLMVAAGRVWITLPPEAEQSFVLQRQERSWGCRTRPKVRIVPVSLPFVASLQGHSCLQTPISGSCTLGRNLLFSLPSPPLGS